MIDGPPPPPPPSGPPPAGPPSMPPPPTGPPPADGAPGRLPPVGDLMTGVTRTVVDRFGDLFALLTVVSISASAAATPLLWRSVRGITLERDGATFTGVEGATAGDGLAIAAALAITVVANALVFAASTEHARTMGAHQPVPWNRSLVAGARRLAPVILVGVAVVASMFAVNVVAGIVAALVPPIAAVVVIVGFGGAVLVWLRCSLAPTHVALGAAGPPIRTSVRITRGLGAALLGRYILLITIIIGLQIIGTFVAAPFQAFSGASDTALEGDLVVSEVIGSNPAAFLASQIVSGLFFSLGVVVWAAATVAIFDDLRSVD